MISVVTETSGAYTDEIKFQTYFFSNYEFLKKNGRFGQKRNFYFLIYSLEIFQTNIIIF